MALEIDLARIPDNILSPSAKQEMLKRIRSVNKANKLTLLNKQIANLQKQTQYESGGLSYEQQAAKSLMRIIKMAMKEIQRKEKD